MNSDYIRDIQTWMQYVNGWMSFWNVVDLACFGAVFCWLLFLTVIITRARK